MKSFSISGKITNGIFSALRITDEVPGKKCPYLNIFARIVQHPDSFDICVIILKTYIDDNSSKEKR